MAIEILARSLSYIPDCFGGIDIVKSIKQATKMNLQIDKKQRTVSLELELDGDSDTLSVKIGSYEIVQENEKTFLKLSNIQASKKLINAAAQLWDGKIELSQFPEKAQAIIRAML